MWFCRHCLVMPLDVFHLDRNDLCQQTLRLMNEPPNYNWFFLLGHAIRLLGFDFDCRIFIPQIRGVLSAYDRSFDSGLLFLCQGFSEVDNAESLTDMELPFYLELFGLLLEFAVYEVTLPSFCDLGVAVLMALVDLGFGYFGHPFFQEFGVRLFQEILSILGGFAQTGSAQFWCLLDWTAESLAENPPDCPVEIGPFAVLFADLIFNQIEADPHGYAVDDMVSIIDRLTVNSYPQVNEYLTARLVPESPASWFVVGSAEAETAAIFAPTMAPHIRAAPWTAIHFVASCAQFTPEHAATFLDCVFKWLSQDAPPLLLARAVDSIAAAAPDVFAPETFDALANLIATSEVTDVSVLASFVHSLFLVCSRWAESQDLETLRSAFLRLSDLYSACFQRVWADLADVHYFVSVVCQVPYRNDHFGALCATCCGRAWDALGDARTEADTAVQDIVAQTVLSWLRASWFRGPNALVDFLRAVIPVALVPAHFEILGCLGSHFPVDDLAPICQFIPEMTDDCRDAAVAAVAKMAAGRPELLDHLPLEPILAPFANMLACVESTVSILHSFFRTHREINDVRAMLSMLVKGYRTWTNCSRVYDLLVHVARQYGLLEQVANDLFAVTSERIGRPAEAARVVAQLIVSENPLDPHRRSLFSAMRQESFGLEDRRER
jgi:hypothetical protein